MLVLGFMVEGVRAVRRMVSVFYCLGIFESRDFLLPVSELFLNGSRFFAFRDLRNENYDLS